MLSELSRPLKRGDLIAFQIGTREGVASLNKERWSVVKVLHQHRAGTFDLITFSVLKGLSNTIPKACLVRFRKVLVEQRFKNDPRAHHSGKHLIFTGWVETLDALTSAKVIGSEWLLRPAERRILRNIDRLDSFTVSGHLANIALTLDQEDRAVHDPVNWRNEIEAARAQSQQRLAAEKEKWANRVKGISIAKLQREPLFATWDDCAEILPPDIVTMVRLQAAALLQSLVVHGPKVPRRAAKKELSDFVVWLNTLDEDRGGLFETEEREDLMGFLEEVCWAAKQKSLVDDLDDLRTW